MRDALGDARHGVNAVGHDGLGVGGELLARREFAGAVGLAGAFRHHGVFRHARGDVAEHVLAVGAGAFHVHPIAVGHAVLLGVFRADPQLGRRVQLAQVRVVAQRAVVVVRDAALGQAQRVLVAEVRLVFRREVVRHGVVVDHRSRHLELLVAMAAHIQHGVGVGRALLRVVNDVARSGAREARVGNLAVVGRAACHARVNLAGNAAAGAHLAIAVVFGAAPVLVVFGPLLGEDVHGLGHRGNRLVAALLGDPIPVLVDGLPIRGNHGAADFVGVHAGFHVLVVQIRGGVAHGLGDLAPHHDLVGGLEQVGHRLAHEVHVQALLRVRVLKPLAHGEYDVGRLGGEAGRVHVAVHDEVEFREGLDPRAGIAQRGHLVARALDPHLGLVGLAGKHGGKHRGNVAVHPAAQALVLAIAQTLQNGVVGLELVFCVSDEARREDD